MYTNSSVTNRSIDILLHCAAIEQFKFVDDSYLKNIQEFKICLTLNQQITSLNSPCSSPIHINRSRSALYLYFVANKVHCFGYATTTYLCKQISY